MTKYIIKRILAMILVVIGVAIVIFTIMYFVPGDPVKLILGNGNTANAYNELKTQLGLDQPYFLRLWNFLKDTFLHFDLGTSWFTGNSVMSEIVLRFPRTVLLAVISVVLGGVIGIPLGVTAAVHQNGIADRVCMFFSIALSCIPQFWLALMLVIVLSVRLRLLPAYGIGGIQYYIIPAAALACQSFAMIARQTRSSMLDVIRQDYVDTSRSHGFQEHDVIYKYALPNALLPVVTVLGTQFAGALGGTIIIETVFSIPGLGLYLNSAIMQRDYPIIQGTVVFLSILFCIIILLIDIAYAVIDPRVKGQYAG